VRKTIPFPACSSGTTIFSSSRSTTSAPGIRPADLVTAARAVGVTDPRLLEAIGAVPRAHFVPPDLAAQAYHDSPLPIPNGQVTTQPSLVAKMVAALELSLSDRALEIGSGFGWQTALLARVADEVWSVERWEDIARTARANFERVGVENATVVVGDGSLGLPEHAPYDAILVAAAFRQVPAPLAEQLAEGGRLVQPIGLGGADEVVRFEKRGGALERSRLVTGAHFVRLYGEHGFAQ
jgi:protein-L-isoaspartate(D-aspartate) O-methyltransferase